MLNLTKIQTLAQEYSPQEIFAALVWQRQFNEFNGEEVIQDLSQNTHLWTSFLFTKPIFAPDEHGLSFGGLVDTLLAMANYRPMPESSIIHFIPYPADTLYILTENQDTIVSQLLDLGKKWRADSVDITDGNNEEYGLRLRRRLQMRLQGGLESESFWEQRDAVVITYWWD
ncbi:hypothetical protein IQ231_13940 [Cuspidothrix issatschenkoi LEGE 03284]|jgi:hypothetical protein|uniref:hypothetical protein n=1 Tax=Cuspidothrix issatschenkoi TaxID=230752 RepID=UPI001882D6AE|nr:hypothetical protein [Cuspidothrix issatschenkoi]MBE9232752.1 hypothetical protein [Cuspidothrix issatschenkoi LEGE 03284]